MTTECYKTACAVNYNSPNFAALKQTDRNMKKLLSALTLLAASSVGHAQVVAHFDVKDRGTEIGGLHYGIFFEEINHAGDGGLYAEMIRNRSFEDNGSEPEFWRTAGKAQLSVTDSNPLNAVNTHSLKVSLQSAGDGVKNEGWWGMGVVKDDTYKVSFWLRTDSKYDGTLTLGFENPAGGSLGSVKLRNVGKESGKWQKYEASFKATRSGSKDIAFVIRGNKPGTIQLDMVSLFPPTFRDRPNGLRKDIAEKIAALHPSFMRFPGGCVVEGNKTAERPQTNRFEWKKTIGPIEERPGHYNNNWFYPVTDGLGMMEYLLFCEDIGAEPLFVCNMGMGHGWEDADVQPYIQEALDAIEFCNGDATTEWGRKRAELGHPKPFGLKMMEIGNENEGFRPYTKRYGMFYEAIHKKYPYMKFIGNGADWNRPHHVDIIDPHFYMSPSWFITEYHRYDDYYRDTYKIYIGEYAAMCGDLNCLNAALGEAVFMCGMERNADVVVMNSYAPLLVNDNNRQWHPDMIPFNHAISVESPSYHVQKMMSNYHGNQNINWTEENNFETHTVKVGLAAYGTSMAYDNLLVTTQEGDTIYFNDFSNDDLSDWTGVTDNWKVMNGRLVQTRTDVFGQRIILGKEIEGDYIVKCDAEKLRGDEGFMLMFNVLDNDNYAWWNCGGWGNKQQGVEQSLNGILQNDGGDIKQMASLELGKTYSMTVSVRGNRAECFLNGLNINKKKINIRDQRLFLAASVDDKSKTIYVKVVNPYPVKRDLAFDIKNATIAGTPVIHTLTGKSAKDENTIDLPHNVDVTTKELTSGTFSAHSVKCDIPALSFSVIEIKF